jgi:hypothetical protein
MHKKLIRKKLNQKEIEKKINDDTIRKFSFIIPRNGTVEFRPPEENHLNRMLGHNKPYVKVNQDGKFSQDGEGGHLMFYYIPESEYKKVNALLTAFLIPEPIHHDLTWVYLNMVFASCEVTYSAHFHEQYERNQKELFEAIELLEAFASDKILLRGITFEYKDKLNDGGKNKLTEYGPLKGKKMKCHVAVQFIEKVLQNYKSSKDFETAQSIHDLRKKYGKPDMFFGHKNFEKQSQSYYSSVIFDYLRQHLFSGLFDLLHNPHEYNKEVARLKKLYSRRKMFLFIGKLMILSGLLLLKEDSLEDDIIENIEKKLTPKLRSNKKTQHDIDEHNRNPDDGMLRVQLFHELF